MKTTLHGSGPGPLTLSAVRCGGTSTVTLAGAVDLAGAPQLRAALRASVACGVTDFVIDCGGVDYLDSSGLRVLVELVELLREAEGTVTLGNPSEMVRRLLAVTGLDTLLEIQP